MKIWAVVAIHVLYTVCVCMPGGGTGPISSISGDVGGGGRLLFCGLLFSGLGCVGQRFYC